MTNTKNEHVFPKEGGWIVRREGSKKTSRLFGNKQDAIEYAGIIALNGGGFVITHKLNGQFKNFKRGSEIYVRMHKISPILTGTLEITPSIASNAQHPIETITSI